MMQSQEWFLQQGSGRLGPLSTDALRELVLAGEVNPRADLLWRSGMEAWMPAGAVEEFFAKSPVSSAVQPETVATRPPEMAPTFEKRPAEIPAMAQLRPDGPGLSPPPGAPVAATANAVRGAGRGSFLFVWLFFPLLAWALIRSTGEVIGREVGKEYGWAFMGMMVLIPILLLFAVAKRLENLEMSRWWSLALSVPILNSWLGYRLVACPPGYGAARKMDVPGILLAVLYWLGVVIGSILLLAVSAALLSKLRTGLEEVTGVKVPRNSEVVESSAAPRPSPAVPITRPQIPRKVRTVPIESPLMAEVEAAWQGGPMGLLALSMELERKRQIDRDGFSNRSQFTEWFGSDARLANSQETLQVLEQWKKADRNRPDAWMAASEFHVMGLRILLETAKDRTPATLPSAAVREFQTRLKAAQNELKTAPNRQYHPTYYTNSLMVLRASGAKRAEFESMASEAILRFPECPAIYSEIALSLAPRHGGKPGEWESCIRRWISALPAQRQARAYAMAVTTVVNEWMPSSKGRKDMVLAVQGKLDRALYEEGLHALAASYPEGAYFENSAVMVYAVVFDSNKEVQQAAASTRGIVNLRVWKDERVYQQILVGWQ